jgi:hypothetical protein
MEIDITSLLEMDCFALSHSAHEGGENAGRNTWQASRRQAATTPLLDTPEKLDAMRDFASESGGWMREEIAAWGADEVNALFLQWIAGDARQLPAKLHDELVEREPGVWYRENDTHEWGPYESRHEAYEDAFEDSRRPGAESLDEIDWPEARIEQEAGQAPGNLFQGDDGRVYFYLGN